MTMHNSNELELHDALGTSSDIVEEHIVGRIEEKEKAMASLLEAMSVDSDCFR